jgi:hypothetical protein
MTRKHSYVSRRFDFRNHFNSNIGLFTNHLLPKTLLIDTCVVGMLEY